MFLDIIYELEDYNVSTGKPPANYLHPLEIRREEKGFPLYPKGKYYAIKDGLDKELNNSIYNWIAYSWEECKFYTHGVKGAKFKSFDSYIEARKYLYMID